MIQAGIPAGRRICFEAAEFPAARVAALKAGQRIAVCIPAHNEEATVATAVTGAATLRRAGIVDDVVVVDDASSDRTAAAAEAAGGRVVRRDGPPGKGAALARAVAATADADVLVFLDADVVNVGPEFVLGLVGPLLTLPDVVLVKAAYHRALFGRPGEGGRVTELVARPLLDRWFPELAGVAQPLAGECAVRRSVVESIAFDPGYAIEIGLLLDVATHFGPDAIAEVDLGERIHRNRPLAELRFQAAAVLDAVLRRVGDGQRRGD